MHRRSDKVKTGNKFLDAAARHVLTCFGAAGLLKPAGFVPEKTGDLDSPSANPWIQKIAHGVSAASIGPAETRRFLWAPIWFGAGIGIYFSLKFEPTLHLPLCAAFVLAALTSVLRRRQTNAFTP